LLQTEAPVIDNNMEPECEMYGAAMAKSKTAGRDKWFTGFASWPEKITTEYESQLTPDYRGLHKWHSV
jgi:hypothetical protein